ncbi:hypothetical protein SCLCIDRAFT_33663 [Scleroderma citrinum Foug A]|uniref:Uncharacterized protein n=1 Tax=Scleroderma citrinum Foug A TaxID=1036808 RepID=A0A0C3CRG6_9AGAM|nr:hypothetical protein SCLCIDRAFT_33663 [Scleroderma citrinum Foug A]
MQFSQKTTSSKTLSERKTLSEKKARRRQVKQSRGGKPPVLVIIVADQGTSTVKKSVSSTLRDVALPFASKVENIPANDPSTVTVSVAMIQEMLEDNKAMFASLAKCNRFLDRIESTAINDLKETYGLAVAVEDSEEEESDE